MVSSSLHIPSEKSSSRSKRHQTRSHDHNKSSCLRLTILLSPHRPNLRLGPEPLPILAAPLRLGPYPSLNELRPTLQNPPRRHQHPLRPRPLPAPRRDPPPHVPRLAGHFLGIQQRLGSPFQSSESRRSGFPCGGAEFARFLLFGLAASRGLDVAGYCENF